MDRNRSRVWANANQALYTTVFGSDYRARNLLGSSYPTGSRRDSEARSLLVEAADALSSVSRFEDALAAGGIFEDASDVATDPDAMFAVLGHEVRVEYRHTNYGRFGVWARTNAESASEGAELDRRNPPGGFAYSPLEQTVYSTADPAYPSNGSAYYEGSTVAVEVDSTPRFFEGNIGISVAWGSSIGGSNLSAVVRDLREVDTGGLFFHNNVAVDEIAFSGITLSGGGATVIGFDSTNPVTRIGYLDAARFDTRWTGSRAFTGKFVGRSIDGPVGVIGTWSLGSSSYSGALEGSYAADLYP